MDCPPLGKCASCSQLRAWLEQKGGGREAMFTLCLNINLPSSALLVLRPGMESLNYTLWEFSVTIIVWAIKNIYISIYHLSLENSDKYTISRNRDWPVTTYRYRYRYLDRYIGKCNVSIPVKLCIIASYWYMEFYALKVVSGQVNTEKTLKYRVTLNLL